MISSKQNNDYIPPIILSVDIAPDITKCMQCTGGIVKKSTFNVYKSCKGESGNNKIPTLSEYTQVASPKSKLIPILVFFLVLFLGAQTPNLYSQEIPILIPQSHPVINEIINGINKGFEELNYSPDKVKITLMDGQGVQANFSTLIDAAIQKKPPLIITITTGLSKTTVDKVNNRIPVVFSGVTDPVGSNIVPDLIKHKNVTGASDLWPIKEQLKLLRRILPDAKSIGVIFKPSEPNSQFGMRIVRNVTKDIDINLVEKGVEDSRDVLAVLDAILPQVDAVYIGPDNMTIELANVIIEKCTHAKTPVFGGEPGTLEKGAIGVVSIRYFDLGRETAKLCSKILSGTPTKKIPVYVAEQGFIGLNYNAAIRLNLSIPAEIRRTASKTIGEYTEPSNMDASIRILPIVLIVLVLYFILTILWTKKRSKNVENN